MPRLTPTPADRELLLAAGSDPDAFGVFYARHEALVTTYLARLTRDADVTADLVAETFCTALIHAPRYRDTGNGAAGWLLSIARNLFLQYLRRGRAEQRARQRLGVDRVALEPASIERVEELMDLDASSPKLRRIFDALPAEQRSAIEAHVLDEIDYSVLADQLGITESTLRQRVSRGLTRMRTALEGASR